MGENNKIAQQELQKYIGDRIRQIRIEKAISQKELADLLFRDKNSIYRIEKGMVNPSTTQFLEICHALEVSPNDILGSVDLTKYMDYKL